MWMVIEASPESCSLAIVVALNSCLKYWQNSCSSPEARRKAESYIPVLIEFAAGAVTGSPKFNNLITCLESAICMTNSKLLITQSVTPGNSSITGSMEFTANPKSSIKSKA